jgi:hypothetical protein
MAIHSVPPSIVLCTGKFLRRLRSLPFPGIRRVNGTSLNLSHDLAKTSMNNVPETGAPSTPS